MADPEADVTQKEAENAKADEKEVDTKAEDKAAKTPEKSGTPAKAKREKTSSSKPAKKGGKGCLFIHFVELAQTCQSICCDYQLLDFVLKRKIIVTQHHLNLVSFFSFTHNNIIVEGTESRRKIMFINIWREFVRKSDFSFPLLIAFY